MKFYEFLESNKDKEIDIYFDMDGVFAEYDIGNFDYNTIRPIKSNIKVIEDLYNKYNVNILSICKTNEIVREKYDWMARYLPFFDKDKMNFISLLQTQSQGKCVAVKLEKKKKKAGSILAMKYSDCKPGAILSFILMHNHLRFL